MAQLLFAALPSCRMGCCPTHTSQRALGHPLPGRADVQALVVSPIATRLGVLTRGVPLWRGTHGSVL
jgi:hypothetical protein